MLGAVFPQCDPRGWQHYCKPQLKAAWERDRQKSCPAQVPPSPHPHFLEARQKWSMREIRPNDYKGVTPGVQWGKCLENQIHKVPLFLVTTWSRNRWNSQKMTNLVKENECNLIIYKVNSSLKRGSFFKQHLDSYSRKQARRKLQTVTRLCYKDFSLTWRCLRTARCSKARYMEILLKSWAEMCIKK